MIIEKIDRSGHVIDIYSFNNNRVSVGRGYANDLILNDSYADESHLKIEFDYLQDAFVVTDLNSLNGVTYMGAKKSVAVPQTETGKITAKSGDSIVIGKTRLRLLKKNHPVVAAKLLSGLDAVLSKLGTWWFLLILISGVLVSEALSAYLADPFAKRLYKEMVQSLYVLFAAVAYGGLWVLVARTQRQDGRFLLHVNLLLLASLLISLYFFFHPILVFNVEWLMYREYLTKALMCIGLFLAIYASCYQSTNLTFIRRMFVSLLLPAFVLLGLVISELNRAEFRMSPPYNMVLVSPAWQWRGAVSETEFLQEADELYLPAEDEND